MLVIIFSNKSYFCFNYTNTFFIQAMNYFSVVLRIIFLMCIENYFFIGPRIIFRGIANSFLGLQCFVGVAVAVDWFEFLTLSIHPKILEILVGTSNGTDHFGSVRPWYSRPALKVVHFDRSGHFGRSDQNVSFHLSKLLPTVPHFCILLTRTSSFQCQVNCCESSMTSQIKFKSVAISFDFWYLPLTVSNNWRNATRRWKKSVSILFSLKPVHDI